MTPETENNKKLKAFFNEEYQSLKAYVNSRIKATVDRDAEDIIQDVALNLFSGADRYTPINNVAGFVYRSIKNKIIDVMRTRKQNINDDDNELKLIEFTELLYGPSDNSYPERMIEDLKQTIFLELKPSYRDIIIAYDLEGYSYKDISNETGIPEGTLMSQRHRAISQLYKKLENKKFNN